MLILDTQLIGIMEVEEDYEDKEPIGELGKYHIYYQYELPRGSYSFLVENNIKTE